MQIPSDILKHLQIHYPEAVILHNRAKSVIWDTKKGSILKLTNCPGAIDWLCTSFAKKKLHMPKVHRIVMTHKTKHAQIFLFEIEKLQSFNDVAHEFGNTQLQTLTLYDAWLMQLSHQLTKCNHEWTKPGKKMTDRAFFKKFNPLIELPIASYTFYKEIKAIRTILKAHKGNAYPDLTGPQDNIMFRSNGDMVILDPIATISVGNPCSKHAQSFLSND